MSDASRRRHPRHRLRKLPGRLILSKEGRVVETRPVDISVEGLGIIAFEPLKPDTEIKLVINEVDEEVTLTVVWAFPETEEEKAPYYQYGLRVTQPGKNLEEIVLKKASDPSEENKK